MKTMKDENGKEIPLYLKNEIIGEKFGNVTVLQFDSIKNKRSFWKCECDCGQICYISRKELCRDNEKRTKISCGCIPKQSSRKNKRNLSDQFLLKFQSLLSKKEDVGECWEWKAAYNNNKKIPWCSWNSQSMSARKCMYLVTNFLTETEHVIYVTCGNHKCVNPDHLSIIPPKREPYGKRETSYN